MSLSLLVILGLCAGPVLVLATGLTCTAEYRAISSTLCLADSDWFLSGGVSAAEQATIVSVHNNFRANVSPTSSNMQKVVWDEKLASMAQKWAQQCQSGHDSYSARKIIEYSASSGQNQAGGVSHTWTSAITSWYDEVDDFTMGIGGATGAKVGHYTQVVLGDVAKIGCGFARCSNSNYFVCNYILAQFLGKGTKTNPYGSGPSCSACGGTSSSLCDNKLCDCGGKVCFNDGTMDLSTCQCGCTSSFGGPQCLTAVCGGKVCQNGGTLDTSTCTCQCVSVFSGYNCETKNCAGTSDPGHCGGVWPPSYCSMFSNVPGDCPWMCGLCP